MRIISLLASATEIIDALGCFEQLVGRSHECDYPPEVQHLPLVSIPLIDTDASSNQIDAQVKQLAHEKELVQNDALRALSIYRIDTDLLQQLQPDVIFTQTQCEVCAVSERDVTNALQQTTGLHPHVVSLAPYQLRDVWEDIVRVGKALGRQEQAEQLVKGYQQRLERLQQRTEGQSRPRVAVLEWLDPLMAAGNWVPELIAYAGGEAVFGQIGMHSPWLQWDELHAADPDVIILSPCGFSIERTLIDYALLQQHPQWPALRAVQQGRVYAIDGNYYLNRSGPRLVESAELLAHAIHGISIDAETSGIRHIM